MVTADSSLDGEEEAGELPQEETPDVVDLSTPVSKTTIMTTPIKKMQQPKVSTPRARHALRLRRKDRKMARFLSSESEEEEPRPKSEV